MLYNHLKIAWRVFSKRKLYGVINITGLSVAMAFCLLVSLYVRDEFGYDKFHEKGDRLYLLHDVNFKTDDLNTEPGILDVSPNPNVEKGISQSLPLVELFANRIPEVEQIIRSEANGRSIEKDGKMIYERVRYTDQAFFDAFTFEFVDGNKETALAQLNSIVITEEVAMKYFGRLKVMGETLKIGDTPYEISGVIKKPRRSSVSVNILFRYEQSYVYKEFRDSWGYSATTVFMLLKEGINPKTVEAKAEAIYKERFAENIENTRIRLSLSEDNPVVTYGLANIQDLYLNPSIRFGKSSSKLYSYILISVAVIMMLIASINYTAISISLSSARSSEVALRKVMGSSRKQLVSQFYTESILMGLAAVGVGFSLMQITIPLFEDLTAKTFNLTVSEQLMSLALGFGLTLILSSLAGAYPAQLMSRVRIVQGIKSQSSHKINPRLIRGMVVFQFTLCIFFIGMGLGMHKQFRYINSMDLGFSKEQVVYLENSWGITDKLKQELSKEPSIVSSVGAGGIFGSGRSLSRITANGVEHSMQRISVDYGFFETMKIDFVSGRAFDPERNRELEAKSLIVNETYYNLIKSDSSMASAAWTENIIGVVKDFHYESLNREIGPIQFALAEPNYISVMYARLQADNIEEGMAAMERAWNTIAPDQIMELHFLDDFLASLYKDSQRWARIIDIAALLAVLIACSGLFGLTGINVMNRTKEIGIRKVLGADFSSIILLLNKQNIWLILISMGVALPAWYYFVNQWIEGFAYHTSVGPELFALAGGLCFIIVIVTVSFHSLRTSRINPATLLRTE